MTTTNYHIHTSKSKDRKKRNLMGSLIEQSQLVSINFDPPYSNEDSINEKIQMTKILGEHPLFFDISKNCVPKKQETDNFRSNTQKYVNFEGNLDVSNLSSNKSPLFKAIENTINYEDRLNKIFQKVKINPLIQKISDKFIEENNSDLNLSYTDDEGVNEIEVNITTMSDFVTYDKQRNEFSLSSLSRQRIEFFESPSSDSTISTEEPPKEKTSKSKTPLENKDLNDKIYFDKNGKPQLIVSIALDLLKDPTGILSLDAINGKKNLNLIKHKNENNENEQHMKLELKTLSDNNLKRSSSSLVGLSEANNKKLKTSDEGASILTNSNNYNAKIKQKNTYKSSTGSNDMIQANSIEIFKQMNTDNPPKLLKLNNIKRIIQNYDFLYKELSEEMFHKRGIAKKHEADTEKESQMKKVTLYMEAVCNFCLCAVTQHQFKKIKPDNSTNLLNDTWNLLKFINEKILRKTENAGFTKKFKVLSNWMESFIFHWLWKLKLIESKALSTALKIIIDSMNTPSNTTPSSIRNNSLSEMFRSPNRVFSTSPQNGHLVNNTKSRSQGQHNQVSSLLEELFSKVKCYVAINDHNIRSQTRWDENEAYIMADKRLLGYREEIKNQVKFPLHINSKVEEFVSSVLSGLQLLHS